MKVTPDAPNAGGSLAIAPEDDGASLGSRNSVDAIIEKNYNALASGDASSISAIEANATCSLSSALKEPAISILATDIESTPATASEAKTDHEILMALGESFRREPTRDDPAAVALEDARAEDVSAEAETLPSKEIFFLDRSDVDENPTSSALVVNTALGSGNSLSSLDSDDVTDEDDDGEGFLKPVQAMSPETPVRFVSTAVKLVENPPERFGTYKTSSLVLERSMRGETALQLGGGKFGSMILSSSAGRTLSDLGNRPFGIDKAGNRVEIPRDLGGQQSHRGSISYGSGSQSYSAQNARVPRSLSFADERGQDLARVTEVHDTHYALSKSAIAKYIGPQCATFSAIILFCLCIAVPLILFISSSQPTSQP